MLRRLLVRRKKHDKTTISRNITIFSFESLRDATQNFTALIGEGGFGKVYKGVLPDGKEVAVKKIDTTKQYLDEDEFLHKIELLSHLQHRNVNQVLGGCVDDDLRIIVSEYEEHGDLSTFLSGSDRLCYRKDWEGRASLCIGIARGLSYLHEDVSPVVIHGDIKSSNILLDKNFDPKIADFDLVDFRDDLDGVAPHSTIRGSLGYLDPEYTATRIYTEKVDVYSFGVLMLEIISGRNATGFPEEFSGNAGSQSMLNWALSLRKCDRILEVIDPLLTSAPVDYVKCFLDVAFLCCREFSKLRPRMSEVVYTLYGGSNFSKEAMRKPKTSRSVVSVHSKDWLLYDKVPGYSLTTTVVQVSNGWETKRPSDSTSQTKGNTTSTEADGSIVANTSSVFKGKGIESCTAPEHAEMKPPSSNTKGQFNMVIDKRMGHSRYLKKDLNYLSGSSNNTTTRKAQTMVIKKYSEKVSMEAVYPPLLTGEYRRSGKTF